MMQVLAFVLAAVWTVFGCIGVVSPWTNRVAKFTFLSLAGATGAVLFYCFYALRWS